MYWIATNVLLLIHAAVTTESAVSTPSPYTASPADTNYVSPSTVEPSIEYKPNTPSSQFQYAKQFFDMVWPFDDNNHNNQYAENLQSLNPFVAKPFPFHRLPFLPAALASYANPSYVDQPSPFSLHGYLPTQQYPLAADYQNQQPYFHQQNPISFQQKFAGTPISPDCDFLPPTLRNSRPILFRPFKLENFFEPSSLIGKPINAFYRY